VPVPNPGPGCPTSYAMVFFLLSDLRGDVTICFVDIDGIVDHHSLTFFSWYAVTSTIENCM
jgi:hypothetical protein